MAGNTWLRLRNQSKSFMLFSSFSPLRWLWLCGSSSSMCTASFFKSELLSSDMAAEGGEDGRLDAGAVSSSYMEPGVSGVELIVAILGGFPWWSSRFRCSPCDTKKKKSCSPGPSVSIETPISIDHAYKPLQQINIYIPFPKTRINPSPKCQTWETWKWKRRRNSSKKKKDGSKTSPKVENTSWCNATR